MLAGTLGVLGAFVSAPAQARTLLDEELEFADRNRRVRDANLVRSLRRGFDAVEKAMVQLEDLKLLLESDPPDWRAARAFARRFNNDVAREGMQPIANGLLNPDDKARGIALCSRLEDSLAEINRAAGVKDRTASLAAVAKCREIISEYLRLRPADIST
jgi:hypothetical protein